MLQDMLVSIYGSKSIQRVENCRYGRWQKGHQHRSHCLGNVKNGTLYLISINFVSISRRWKVLYPLGFQQLAQNAVLKLD
jgi:hypothetical protein